MAEKTLLLDPTPDGVLRREGNGGACRRSGSCNGAAWARAARGNRQRPATTESSQPPRFLDTPPPPHPHVRVKISLPCALNPTPIPTAA